MAESRRVAGADELGDGELAAYEVDGRFVAVARVGDEVYAFDDVCTHRGCSLSEGVLEGHEVVCPCHAGTFDVRTGEVVDGPPPEPVETFPARVADGGLFVDL
jgi:nitrite reductase/ring-hydroxylating ferredoxin subunit